MPAIPLYFDLAAPTGARFREIILNVVLCMVAMVTICMLALEEALQDDVKPCSTCCMCPFDRHS